MACTEIDTFADIKRALEKACSKVKCKYDKKPIEDFMANLERLDAKRIKMADAPGTLDLEGLEELPAFEPLWVVPSEASGEPNGPELPDEAY
jgi:hypothetical protein